MKKILSYIIAGLFVMSLVSCQQGVREDKNGDTPTSVVEKMYKAINSNDFETAASYNKFPDTIKIKPEKDENMYEQFKNNQKDKDGKYIIPKEEWKSFIINKMKENVDYSLESWEIVSEEISKTDPNSAQVKTKIHVKVKGEESVIESSFPLKRENDIWLIIG